MYRVLFSLPLLIGLGATAPVYALDLKETPTLERTHKDVALPPIAERVPAEPLIVDLSAKDRINGKHGGDLNTLIGRKKDVRLVNVWGYARLVGFDENLNLVPDILKSATVEDGRIFTLTLRKGHRWSNGEAFAAEDFRYWWEDIANNKDLAPAGPPPFMYANGQLPVFKVVDEVTVRYTWKDPNPGFLPTLAKARPPFIYRPSHYLKNFHAKYGDVEALNAMAKEQKMRSWAPLHNRVDNMYKASNPDLPTLQPWHVVTGKKSQRSVAIRNPFYHRVDSDGRQLPYIDRLILSVSNGRLIPTKTNAGESALQARNIAFADVTVLKSGEESAGYTTKLWPIAKGAHLALYPNLTATDPEWRKVMRDVRFRRALSLGIDRELVNNAMYFGIAVPSNNTVLPESPLYREELRTKWAEFDPDKANALLDEMGLAARDHNDIRLLPDDRPLEIIVETAGESQEQVDALELIKETWAEIGVALFTKPTQREVLRKRALSGALQMSIWEGYDNGIPTPQMEPAELAPVQSTQTQWAGWGAYYESKGQSGEEIDHPEAKRLFELYQAWGKSKTDEERGSIWTEMLDIQADQLFSIGVISGVRQPVAVSNALVNVPEEAIYGWDPGAQYGLHRMDEFWIDPSKEGAGVGQ